MEELILKIEVYQFQNDKEWSAIMNDKTEEREKKMARLIGKMTSLLEIIKLVIKYN